MHIRVHMEAGARREKITKIHETEFNIAVREPRTRNLANTRMRELLAQTFSVPLSKVQLLTGHRSSTKMVGIEKISG
jgi:uncharacterized protein YggU (UPF0235/DUF167 family)